MTPQRQVLLTVLAAQKILMEANVNDEQRNDAKTAARLTFLFENLYLDPAMKDYQRTLGLAFDDSAVALLVEEARQAADRELSSFATKTEQ